MGFARTDEGNHRGCTESINYHAVKSASSALYIKLKEIVEEMKSLAPSLPVDKVDIISACPSSFSCLHLWPAPNLDGVL